MKRHLALVEDDEVILANYADFLVALGFRVDRYAGKDAALQGLFTTLPDLVLLDITLDGERDAGFAICAEIRRRAPDLPVIFLTSHDAEVDKISGLRLGADDYITKDVSLDYLVVRIEALFRRIEAYAENPRGTGAKMLGPDADEVEFNTRTWIARWRSRPVELTLTQVWMLKALCDGAGRTLSHDELMVAAKITVAPNTIAAHVKAIRRAFGHIDPAFDRIHSERGRGYRWIPR